MKNISLFMDVEDPINPLADDAALDLADLFTDAGIRGSFCLTGEKCRTLKARARSDVADAYRPHSLGLHTNTHSFHPSTMELLADLDWEAGCAAAYDSERKGFDAFVALFDRAPEFWGGGGNTWSPEITDALKRLQIAAYVYALTRFPNEAVHQFNGVVAMPQAFSISETEWADDALAPKATDRVLSAIGRLEQPWIGVFVGHPTKFRYENWWDVPYYAGRTPPEPEYGTPLPEEIYERSKANLRQFLDRIQSEYPVIGVDEALDLPWKFRHPTPDELAYYEKNTAASVGAAKGWPIHYPGLSSDRIVAKTMTLTSTALVGYCNE